MPDFKRNIIEVFDRAGTEWTHAASVQSTNFIFGSKYAGMGLDLSADGNVLAIGDPAEDGAPSSDDADSCRGVNPVGCQISDLAGFYNAGAVAIFRRNSDDGLWVETDYLKSYVVDEDQNFGVAVSLSDNGNRLIVGAPYDDSSGTGIDPPATPFGILNSGAAYTFVFDGVSNTWQEDAFIKASNTEQSDLFGSGTVLSGDGKHAVVFTSNEDSTSVGMGGDQQDNETDEAGAFYVYSHAAGPWQFRAYGKAPKVATFGATGFRPNLALDTTAATLALGHPTADAVFIY
ncbi:MAG: FG-GAP repeat protein [Proteobacteria bacterium]|nr:FG-GAP repeat protein [Pseudomonadota bacterium]